MTSVSEKNPKLISEWDDANELSPEQVSYGSNKKVMWHGACGHRWEPYEDCVCIRKTDDSREAFDAAFVEAVKVLTSHDKSKTNIYESS